MSHIMRRGTSVSRTLTRGARKSPLLSKSSRLNRSLASADKNINDLVLYKRLLI